MSNRIRGHLNHTHRSVFHHVLIKLFIYTVLQKKILIDKQFGFVKRFKKEMVGDLMQDNTEENSSCQGFKESVDEDGREALDNKKDHVVKDEKMEKTFELNSEEDICSTEQNQRSMCI